MASSSQPLFPDDSAEKLANPDLPLPEVAPPIPHGLVPAEALPSAADVLAELFPPQDPVAEDAADPSDSTFRTPDEEAPSGETQFFAQADAEADFVDASDD